MFVSVFALMVSGIRIQASVKRSLLSASGKDCCLASGGEVRSRVLKAFEDLVKRVVECFNASGLDYMFTGALAVSYYGRARTTTDVDVVVAVSGGEWRGKLVSGLEDAGIAADEKKIDAALQSGYRIVTLKDRKSPLTVDVMLSEGELKKRAGSILGLPTFYQVPEDLVLAKLRMIKATVPRERALKDVEDVRAVLEFADVDVEGLKKRARKEGTLAKLEGLLSQAG